MDEMIIVTLTSYGKRMANIPQVVDTILSQTIRPDLIVINIADDELVPSDVMDYLTKNSVEVNRVEDTKVYKKLIPTLRKYPKACVITIDDDFLYPNNMISEFISMHQRYPEYPLSGNRVIYEGMQCHCGCASLTKAAFWGDYLYQIDDEIINHCPSDDLLYTFISTKAGHPYLQTENEYFINMESCYDDVENSYSKLIDGEKGIKDTFVYLVRRFGPIEDVFSLYEKDCHVGRVLQCIHQSIVSETEKRIRASRSYRLGKFLLAPLSWLKRIG